MNETTITPEYATETDVITITETVYIREDRPFWTTSFEDYTVTEGLLLCLLLSAFGAVLWKLLKGGLSWLY